MKALVVGGTGPTGPFIVRGLRERGYQVTIFHRGTHEVELPSGVEHIHGDPHFLETIEEALGERKFDLVIAAYGRLRYLAEAMRKRTSRFIALGGVGVYKGFIGPADSTTATPFPTPEEAPLVTDPQLNRFAYLMVKSEEAVMKAHKKGFYNATIFRLPMVYGPRQPIPMEWSVIRRILDRRGFIIVPDGGLTLETRIYAENAAHAILLAVDNPDRSAGQIYNLADERVLSLYDWISLITKIMGYEWEIVSMPSAIAKPSRPYVSYTGAHHHRVVDIRKIKEELGYRDLVPLEEAMRRTVDWYLANRPEPGGEAEQRLQDPFDYQAEDKLVKAYKESIQHLQGFSYTLEERHHPYAHPKEPGRIRDHRQR